MDAAARHNHIMRYHADKKGAVPHRFSLVLPALVILAAGCSNSPAPPATVDAGPSVPGGHLALGQLPDIDVSAVLAHTKALSSDEFEGRLPGTKGEQLTVAYLVDQFKQAGLKPGNSNGTYTQKVPLVGITPAPASLVVKKGRQEQTVSWREEYVAWTRH